MVYFYNTQIHWAWLVFLTRIRPVALRINETQVHTSSSLWTTWFLGHLVSKNLWLTPILRLSIMLMLWPLLKSYGLNLFFKNCITSYLTLLSFYMITWVLSISQVTLSNMLAWSMLSWIDIFCLIKWMQAF